MFAVVLVIGGSNFEKLGEDEQCIVFIVDVALGSSVLLVRLLLARLVLLWRCLSLLLTKSFVMESHFNQSCTVVIQDASFLRKLLFLCTLDEVGKVRVTAVIGKSDSAFASVAHCC